MKPLAICLAVMLAGCAPMTKTSTESRYNQKVYAGASKSEVWEAVMASLAAHDLQVVAASFDRGKIRARQHNYLDRRFAACPNIDRLITDPLSPANLGVRASPLYRGVDLKVEIAETETGTRLSLDPRYSHVGRDYGRRDFAIQVRCRSTGVLEHALFTRAAGR